MIERNSVILSLVEKLMEPHDRELFAQRNEFIKKNCKLVPTASPVGFLFRGRQYVSGDVVRGSRLTNLHHSLTNEWAPYHTRFVKRAQHAQLFLTVLEQLTEGAIGAQEFRDALPECIAQLSEFKSVPRKESSPLYLNGNRDSVASNYNKTLPIMQEYAIYHLIS